MSSPSGTTFSPTRYEETMQRSKTEYTAIKSIAGIVLSLVLLLSSGVQIPVLDSNADAYFRDSITKAGVSYGVSRVINATVSVIQQSSIELEPAGIGMSLAVGQVVDPINDLVERLSNVLVMSIVSLGVQELAYEISITIVPQLIAVLLCILSLLVWFRNDRVFLLRKVMVSALVIVTIARFCLPLSSMANEFLQEAFFDEKITEANEKLTASTSELNKMENIEIPKADGFIGTIGSGAAYIKEKSADFKNTIQIIMENRGVIVENLLRLTFLYLGIFVIQVLVLPLLIFWLLMRVINSVVLTTAMTSVGQPSEQQT